ncbi:MAG: hypothetical protein CEE40_08935 [Chloroflexi bacterium B3_Chlor]|nr:MAG: hypothetical protein CEE40_08935 [Chloroflexi bacterium B3_Chlor]
MLIMSGLIFSGCARTTEQPTGLPTTTPTAAAVEGPDPVRARDAALVYVIGHYGEQAPWRNLIWLEEEITPEGLVGHEAYQYAAGDWVITISHPVVAPEAVVYSVVVANETTGFRWEGDVDAVGRVTGAPEGVVAARDAALAYLSERYGEEAPPPGLDWAEEFIPPEGWAPSGTYPYRAGDWVVWVYDAGVAEAYQVLAANETTGFQWEGEVDAGGHVTETTAPIGGQPVVGWYGHVVSLPADAQFDDYLALEPEGAGEIGLEGADAEIEAEIEGLRDKEEPEKYAHFWGTLTCDVLDYGGCQLVVTRLRSGRAIFDPDPVEGWEGQVFSVPGVAQFHDYFVLDGPFAVQYGIEGADEALMAQLEDFRDTSATIRIWGEIQCGIPDTMGCSIRVERCQLVSEESPPLGVHFESPAVGWYGRVVGLPAGARYDDYLHLLPEGAGDVGLTGTDAAIEAEIEGLRDSGTNAHFWGAIACGVPDHDGCQVTVSGIIPEGAGTYADPDPVEGWEGRYFFGAGLGEFDDCFILDFYGPFGVRYGIQGADEALQAALEELRNIDKYEGPIPDIRIWGEMQCGVPDVNGCQIIVDRLEELFSRP